MPRAALVRDYASRFHRLEVVDNPKRITVGGLNAGLAVAKGDCWIIIGAHSEVASDFVSASVRVLARTGAACVGGPIETIGQSLVGRAIAAAMSSPFGVGDARFRYSDQGGEVDTVPFGCYHRRVWEVVGPFDETVDGADEDSYNTRVRQAGGRIVLDPAIRSSYYPRESLRALAEQYAGYGAAKGTLFRRGRRLRARHFAPSAMVLGGGMLLLLGKRWRRARRLLRLLGGVYVSLGDVRGARRGSEARRDPRARFRGDGDHARRLRPRLSLGGSDRHAAAPGRPLMVELRIPFFRPDIDEDDIAAVTETLRGGWLTSGPNVAAFEEELAAFTAAEQAVVVNSCTAAMHLALVGWDIGEGDEVITTPYTFSSTVSVILQTGARPVLVDIRSHDRNIDPEQIGRAVTPRTKAILPVHFGGEPCAMGEILEIAKSRDLKVLEDAAHAIGSAYRGRRVGAIGDATAFSFYATKSVTTGEGGALTTNDEDLAARVRSLSLHGMTRDAWGRYDRSGSWRYDVAELGFKDNLPDPAAALGRSQLRKAERLRAQRTAAVERYCEHLAGEEHLRVPRGSPDNESAWHLFVVHLDRNAPVARDEVIGGLAERGIQASVHFIPIHHLSAFRRLELWGEGDFPVADAAFAGAISLPLFPAMTPSEVDEVCAALREILRD